MADRQAMLVAIVPKFGAALSLIGSSCIIAEVETERRKAKIKSPSRVLFSMSFSDLFFSTGWFLSSWPSPRYTAEWNWQPLGNTQTCSFQAFIIQVGWVATPMFNLMLTLFYMLMIRYNYQEKQLTRLEPWIYGFIWTFSVGSAILGVALKLFNSFSTGYYCWFDSLPQGCSTDPNVECIRGQNSPTWAIFFQSIPLWPCIILSAVFMGMIYQSVNKMERRNTSYAGNRQAPRSTQFRRSQAVARQAWWYIGAFLITFIPDQISTMLYLLGNGNSNMDIIAVAFLPAQGFFNFIVFLRSREQLHTRVTRVLRKMLFCACCGENKTRTTPSMKTNGLVASVIARISRRREASAASCQSSRWASSKDETRQTPSHASLGANSTPDVTQDKSSNLTNATPTVQKDGHDGNDENDNPSDHIALDVAQEETDEIREAPRKSFLHTTPEDASQNETNQEQSFHALQEAESETTISVEDEVDTTVASITSANEALNKDSSVNVQKRCTVESCFSKHSDQSEAQSEDVTLSQRLCREELHPEEDFSIPKVDSSIGLKV